MPGVDVEFDFNMHKFDNSLALFDFSTLIYLQYITQSIKTEIPITIRQ